MRSKLRLMFIFICLGALGVHGQGIGDRNRPSGKGNFRITGKVYFPDGSPAKDVTINVSGAEFNGGSARTDLDGAFTISGLAAGNYSVSIREKGYQNESEFLTIPEGTTSGQAFTLIFHLRNPGEAKRTAAAANPLLKDIPKEPLSKYTKGMEKLGSGDAKAAVPFFDQAIALHPQFPAAYYERGSALLKNNETDHALESFVKAVELKPDYLEAKYSIGYTQYLKKNYEVAAAIFDDVIKQKKDMAEAHMYLGISLFQLKNVDAAEASLKAAVAAKDNETTALAHRFLGGIYIQKKRNAEAASELQRYVDLVPKAPDADRLRSTIADLKKKT